MNRRGLISKFEITNWVKCYFYPMRTGYALLLGLAISISGMLYKPMVTYPLSLFYTTEIGIDSTDYSKYPGHNATGYWFFTVVDGVPQESIHELVVFGVPMLFYMSIFLVLGMVKQLIAPSKPPPVKEQQSGNSKYVEELIKKKAEKPWRPYSFKRGLIALGVCVLVFIIGFLVNG